MTRGQEAPKQTETVHCLVIVRVDFYERTSREANKCIFYSWLHILH